MNREQDYSMIMTMMMMLIGTFGYILEFLSFFQVIVIDDIRDSITSIKVIKAG